MRNVTERSILYILKGGNMSERTKKQSGKKGKDIPMALQLRVVYGFASAKEQTLFARLNLESKIQNKKVELSGCEPSGCESTADTGGCDPGTSCLFTCLQTDQK